MADASVTVHLWPGEPITGLWCDDCNLPSVVRQRFYLVAPWTADPLATWVEPTVCQSCGKKKSGDS